MSNVVVDLRPCPFCGGADIHHSYIGSSDWVFECAQCEASTTFFISNREPRELDRAVTAWNTRAELGRGNG